METTSWPEPDCWLSPLARVGRSTIAGEGLFAAAPVPRGTVISRFGGRLVPEADLRRLLDTADSYVDTLAIGHDLHLVLPPGVPHHAGNHSCAPNLWWADPFSVIARRDIARGAELTLDYATITDDPDFTMPCVCGAASCRGQVSGVDWKLTRLQAAYGQHWVPVLRERIAAREDAPESG